MNTKRMMVVMAMLVLLVGCTGNTVSWTRQVQTETAEAAPIPGGAPPQSQTQMVINSANGKLPGIGGLNMPGSVQVPAAPVGLPSVGAPPATTEIGPKLDGRLTDIEARIEELRVWLIHTYAKDTVQPTPE